MLSLILFACPKIDQQAWRSDQTEQIVLMENAQLFWQGVRWGEPTRASKFIEDPLERARFEASFGGIEYTDVKVLHAELDEKEVEMEEQEIWRMATVYVHVEQIEKGYSVVSKEIEQEWYRKPSGWFVTIEKTGSGKAQKRE